MMRTGGLLLIALGLAGCRDVATVNRDVAQVADHQRYGFGRPATTAEIDAIDTDVMPDGTGLPEGAGTVQQGESVYSSRCVACHGPTGTEGPFDVLVGRLPGDSFPFGTDPRARSTIGSYWPHAPIVFDYIRRSMPFDAPGSLTDTEVYSLVALLLHWNDLIPADAVVDAQYLAGVTMPAAGRFVMDDRVGGSTVR